MELVVDLGLLAEAVTRAYHLYANPRFVNRWAVSFDGATSRLPGNRVLPIQMVIR
jgi:hypothetical protein